MSQLNKNTVGLTTGLFYVFCHIGWVIMVAVGAAKPLLDWVLSLHFLNVTYSMEAFQLLPALLLMVVAFVSGYVMGWFFAALWNGFNR